MQGPSSELTATVPFRKPHADGGVNTVGQVSGLISLDLTRIGAGFGGAVMDEEQLHPTLVDSGPQNGTTPVISDNLQRNDFGVLFMLDHASQAHFGFLSIHERHTASHLQFIGPIETGNLLHHPCPGLNSLTL